MTEDRSNFPRICLLVHFFPGEPAAAMKFPFAASVFLLAALPGLATTDA
jgi:hypothetical protein